MDKCFYSTKQYFKRKLASQKGASLTAALILLLICTVLGSIVLTAANSSASNVKDNALNDRDYYSVRSAAALFQEAIDGKVVVIENAPGTPGYYSIKCNDAVINEKYFLYGVSQSLEEGFTGIQSDTLKITLTPTDDAETQISTTTNLTVNVDITLEPDGNMKLAFKNGTSGSVFATANMYVSASIQADPWVWEEIDDSAGTPTTIPREGTRTTITWIYNGMS